VACRVRYFRAPRRRGHSQSRPASFARNCSPTPARTATRRWFVIVARHEAATATMTRWKMNGCASLGALLFCSDARTGSFIIRLYQCTLSPLLRLLCGPDCGCRFTRPVRDIFWKRWKRMALGTESWLGLKRLARCQHGVDVGTTRCRRAGRADLRTRSVAASDRANRIYGSNCVVCSGLCVVGARLWSVTANRRRRDGSARDSPLANFAPGIALSGSRLAPSVLPPNCHTTEPDHAKSHYKPRSSIHKFGLHDQTQRRISF